jgi:hypothetical protein
MNNENSSQLPFGEIKVPKNPVGFKKPKNKKNEEKLQLSVAKYVRLAYPGTIFNSDVASGMRMNMGQAMIAKMMRSESGQPDLTIMEPRGKYGAMCMELKKDKSEVYLKDGVTLKQDEHIHKQAKMLERLRGKGYWANFVCSFDDAVHVIDEYMKLPVRQ